MCSSMQGGGSFYCGTVEAYYRGSSGPLTTVSAAGDAQLAQGAAGKSGEAPRVGMVKVSIGRP